jgi:hypothetical protein
MNCARISRSITGAMPKGRIQPGGFILEVIPALPWTLPSKRNPYGYLPE